MISFLAQSLVVAGVIIMIGALVPIRRLIVQLPPGPLRNRWYVMAVLIGLFIAGYLGYAGAFWNRHSAVLDLIVPGIFFPGAIFVWLTATLSLQTAMDVMRISRLERETVTDALTGAFNRRYLDRRLSEEVSASRRYARSLSILLIDIDHFKNVNDTHGHQAGDCVLVALGKILTETLRESDTLARYGGEEFLIIAPHTPVSGAIEVAERLRMRVESHEFSLPDEAGPTRAIRVTVSIGVASLGDGVDNVEKLVKAADKNLYRAKAAGRNRVIGHDA